MTKRMLRRIALLALFLLPLSTVLPAGAQTFEEANAAYARGDYATALRGLRPLAEQGDAMAQTLLGVMYHNGAGVPQDHAEAVRWYRRAAEQGRALAQAKLGNLYINGDGVPQDYAEAAKWFRPAAEQGHALAQFSLGMIYIDGRGVPQDQVQAHKWLNLAASRLTGEAREHAVKLRDLIAERLTTAEIARAQQLAREWRPRTEAAPSAPTPVVAVPSTTAPILSPPGTNFDDGRRRIAGVQRALARLGYDPGPPDGVLGPRTQVAIRAFQIAAGMPVDGTLSDGLEGAILSAVLSARR